MRGDLSSLLVIIEEHAIREFGLGEHSSIHQSLTSGFLLTSNQNQYLKACLGGGGRIPSRAGLVRQVLRSIHLFFVRESRNIDSGTHRESCFFSQSLQQILQ